MTTHTSTVVDARIPREM